MKNAFHLLILAFVTFTFATAEAEIWVPKRERARQRAAKAQEAQRQREGGGRVERKGDEAPNWRARAESELVPKPQDVQANVQPTAATVVTRDEAPSNPIAYEGVQLGIGIQSYQPEGQMRVIGLDTYDVSSLGSSAMFSGQLRWLPWQTTFGIGEYKQPLAVGFVSSIGYAQQPVKIYGPSGSSLGRTALHSTLVRVGPAIEWVFPRNNYWSVAGELGFGRLDLIQSSVLQLANTSERAWLMSPSIAVRYRWGDVFLSVAYDNRSLIFSDTSPIGAQAHNVTLGLLYGLR